MAEDSPMPPTGPPAAQPQAKPAQSAPLTWHAPPAFSPEWVLDPETDTMPFAAISGTADRDNTGTAAREISAEAEHAAEPPASRRSAFVTRVLIERRVKQQANARKAAPRRAYSVARTFAVVIVILAAGSLALALARHAAVATARGGLGAASGALGAGMATRNLAAAWVANQVSRTAIVACDPVMCQALEAHGIANSDLLELRPGTADPLGSDVIVATAAVRSQFGGRLSSVYAPTVIAGFGHGNPRITVRVVAPDGAAAYKSALRADLLARQASGARLLLGPRIVVSAVARSQLTAGQVDSRLLTTIAGMAARRPVDIVAFGDSPPGAGAGAGSPLRSADLAGAGGAAPAGSPADLRSMLSFLRAQRTPYPPSAEVVRRAGGQAVLRIEFPAPSPLGLPTPPIP